MSVNSSSSLMEPYMSYTSSMVVINDVTLVNPLRQLENFGSNAIPMVQKKHSINLFLAKGNLFASPVSFHHLNDKAKNKI